MNSAGMDGIGAEILGVVAVGIGAAALAFAGLHAARKAGLDLPRWLMPAAIGLAMVIYSVWNDYAWSGRAAARLTPDQQVIMTGQGSLPWAPWTFVAPVTLRMAVLDGASLAAQPDGTRQARIMLVQRRGPTVVVTQGFDCAAGRIRPPGGDWAPAPDGDPALAAVCAQEIDGATAAPAATPAATPTAAGG